MALIYKVFIWLGLALIAILIVENMVMSTTAYVFWWQGKSWMVSMITAIIGAFVGYGIHAWMHKPDKYDVEFNDYDF